MNVVILACGFCARVFEESHLELALRDVFLRIKSLSGAVNGTLLLRCLFAHLERRFDNCKLISAT